METDQKVEISSYSRLNAYQRCPRKFYYSYVQEAPEETTPVALIFGSAIHEACESYLKSLSIKPLSQDTINFTFRRALEDQVKLAEQQDAPVDWEDDTYFDLVAKGEAMLASFREAVPPSLKIVGTEVAVEIEIAPGYIIKGVIDVIIDEGNNRYRVVDLKTAAKAYSEHQLLYDAQPTIYIMGAEQLLGAPGAVSFEYWMLMKTKKSEFKIVPVVRTEQDRMELLESLRDAQTGVDAGVFPRLRGWQCSGCQYAKRCNAVCSAVTQRKAG